MADNVLCHVCMQCFMPKMLLCIFAYLSLLSWFGSLLNSYSSIDAAFTYIYIYQFLGLALLLWTSTYRVPQFCSNDTLNTMLGYDTFLANSTSWNHLVGAKTMCYACQTVLSLINGDKLCFFFAKFPVLCNTGSSLSLVPFYDS